MDSSLELNQEEAASLYLLLELALDTLDHRKAILQEIKKLPIDQRADELKEDTKIQEVINLNETLKIDGLTFLKELGVIMIELEPKKNQPLLKPKFKGQ